MLQRGVEITSDYPIIYIHYYHYLHLLTRVYTPNGGCLGFLPSTVAPENRPGPQKEKIVFQPSIFRAELGVDSGSVMATQIVNHPSSHFLISMPVVRQDQVIVEPPCVVSLVWSNDHKDLRTGKYGAWKVPP